MWLPACRKLQSLNKVIYAKCYWETWRNLSVGDSIQVTRVFTAKDVATFAEVTGDLNPIHIDAAVAERTRFGRCIVHGAFLNGLISAIIGMKLPGEGSVLINQYLEFCVPLFVDEEVTAKVEVASIKRKVVECTYFCEATHRKEIVMKGYAKILFMQLEGSPTSKQEDGNAPSSN